MWSCNYRIKILLLFEKKQKKNCQSFCFYIPLMLRWAFCIFDSFMIKHVYSPPSLFCILLSLSEKFPFRYSLGKVSALFLNAGSCHSTDPVPLIMSYTFRLFCLQRTVMSWIEGWCSSEEQGITMEPPITPTIVSGHTKTEREKKKCIYRYIYIYLFFKKI